MDNTQIIFSKIPSVNQLMENLKNYSHKIDNKYLKIIIENSLQTVRKQYQKYKLDILSRDEITHVIENLVKKEILSLSSPILHQVVNGTGVILHTGLGRAPLGLRLIQSLKEVSMYTNLELNLKSGKRGQRLDHVIPLLRILTGCEDAVVTNNNAAAVLLCLNSIAKRKEVIISRGELVEIGGSFRMPEVMKSSGAKMIEVGATNKTHLSDYEAAINDKTGAIMLVHPSNFEIHGFTAKPEIKDIVNLAKDRNIPVIYDLGSGALVNMEKYKLHYEPVVSEMVDLDIDLISFSGDKLLGGPQAGIVVGKQKHIKKLKSNHLLRALRTDKITLNLLTQTLKTFLHQDTLSDNNLSYYYFNRNLDDLKKLQKLVFENLKPELKQNLKVVESEGRIGSGAYPIFPLKSISLQITPPGLKAEAVARKFRQNKIPILGYIEADKFHINLLTIHENDIEIIVEFLNTLI